MSQLPFKLSGFNVFVAGRGYAGLATEVELPKLAFETEEHRSGGMDVPIQVEMGMEALECSLTLAEYDPAAIRLFGFGIAGAIDLVLRGALKRDAEVSQIVITLSGRIKELDFGSWKKGDDTELKAAIAVEYYKLERDGLELIEIDAKNLVRRISGIDQLAAVRRALLL